MISAENNSIQNQEATITIQYSFCVCNSGGMDWDRHGPRCQCSAFFPKLEPDCPSNKIHYPDELPEKQDPRAL